MLKSCCHCSVIFRNCIFIGLRNIRRTRVTCCRYNHLLGLNCSPDLHVQMNKLCLLLDEERHIVSSCCGFSTCFHTTLFRLLHFLSFDIDLWSLAWRCATILQGVMYYHDLQMTFYIKVKCCFLFLGTFSCQGYSLFYNSTSNYDLWHEYELPSGSVSRIRMPYIGPYPLISRSR